MNFDAAFYRAGRGGFSVRFGLERFVRKVLDHEKYHSELESFKFFAAVFLWEC
ncbi:hypothetical protein K6Y31_07435 [Motilimonas cestriensis]|uniref:Uncharacterized protein n=1 Tax=Motilimonas cestriensis TaxID=2742685 RepID=A0ABS8W8Q0_9GAMM|nr:hypothetical protein [Motilimonas cestriensis]MCE2594645.1 hypothetical protein [Motilimonas cestriensis]